MLVQKRRNGKKTRREATESSLGKMETRIETGQETGKAAMKTDLDEMDVTEPEV
jgi:hypothetical protein